MTFRQVREKLDWMESLAWPTYPLRARVKSGQEPNKMDKKNLRLVARLGSGNVKLKPFLSLSSPFFIHLILDIFFLLVLFLFCVDFSYFVLMFLLYHSFQALTTQNWVLM